MIGSSNEAAITIEDTETIALIDTGSCVSTITDTFYKQHLNDTELQPVNGLLKIECADGNSLPYDGFIEASIQVKGIPMEHTQHCIFLIVPESTYSKKVPVLIGTNIITELQQVCIGNLGEKYLQNSALLHRGILHLDAWF